MFLQLEMLVGSCSCKRTISGKLNNHFNKNPHNCKQSIKSCKCSQNAWICKNILQGKTLVPVRLSKDLEMEIVFQLPLENICTDICCDFHRGLGA